MVSGNTGCLPLLRCNDDDDDDGGGALTVAGVNGFQWLSQAGFSAGRAAIMMSHVTSLALAVNLILRPLVSRELACIDRRGKENGKQGPTKWHCCH